MSRLLNHESLGRAVRSLGPTTRLSATAIAIFYVFLWSTAYVPSKVGVLHSNGLWFLVLRFIAAGALLSLLAVAVGQRFPNTARGWFVACGLGILANAGYLGLTYTALHHLSSGMGAIIASTNPLLLSAIAPRLLGERLSLQKALGLVAGFGGVVAIVYARAGSGSAAPADVLLAFLGVCSSVASTILFKRSGTTAGLVALTAVQLVTAGVVLVPFALLVPSAVRVEFSWQLIASFAYLVFVISIGASLLWFRLLQQGEASRVSAFYFLTPAFGLALSALLLHEAIDVNDLFGLAAVAAGIYLVQRA